jgi:hypothetical protein
MWLKNSLNIGTWTFTRVGNIDGLIKREGEDLRLWRFLKFYSGM